MDVRYEVGTGEGRVRCYGAEEALDEVMRRPEEQAYDYALHRHVTVEELQERVEAQYAAEAEAEEAASPAP
jgi:hypothetical protein